VLDAHDASFVSVTQQFNTTTSMGRLTLNMLLSFAQFEREIAGERIRDKIAASKAKGMWMGGNVPLGYAVRERKLAVSEAEASTVRMIFQRYAELGSVALLKAELERAGIVSKRREGADGELSGGKRFSRGALYLMLQNWLYRGNVAHKEKIYPGQHEAIIAPELWQAVQDSPVLNRRHVSSYSEWMFGVAGGASKARYSDPNPVRHLMRDPSNQHYASALSGAHVKKQVNRERKLPAFSLSIGELEVLWSRLRKLFDDPADIYARIQIRLPSEQLEFANFEELKQYPHLPPRATNFDIWLSQKERRITIHSQWRLGSSSLRKNREI
jgi:hypothetical protein